jgi:hypothetical protein
MTKEIDYNICPVCREPVLEEHPKVMENGELLHIYCSIKIGDGEIIDAEQEDN